MYKRNYVIVITGTEDIIAIIAEVTRYNYFISYLPIPEQLQFNKITNLISEFLCYKYLFLLLSSRHFWFTSENTILGK